MAATTASVASPGWDVLEQTFASPPREAQMRAYWWWLNGNVTREAITRDLEWMKRIGMGGCLLFDATGTGGTFGGHTPVPTGPMFGSPAWRQLFKHSLLEAERLGLEIGLNIQSGWNLGGPMVTPDRATKIVAWSELAVEGPKTLVVALPKPKGFFRDSFVLAYRLKANKPEKRRPIRNLKEKCVFDELGFSAANCTPLLEDDPAMPGEEDALAKDVLDLSDKLAKDGTLRWTAPEGKWTIFRFGYINSGAKVSTASGKWQGMVVDYLDADAMRWYWREVVDPLIADAGPLCGKVWTMVQTDSWELGGVNWTPAFPEEFRKRRGYDIRPWLPVIAGRIVESRDASNRFLNDFRRTIADCIADNHYGTMAALARQHGMGIQPESAGPHTAPLDGLQCYGRSAWPMSEFWAPSPHRPTDRARFFVKQAASAAHIYGKPIVCAEGFTSIGPHWDEVLWSALKPSFDHEACAGLNLVFWCAFTCSPREMGLPGQDLWAGTHFNPQITWANQAHAFVAYLNRCQALLQQGEFVADVLYYYGNHVPNIGRLKQDDPAGVLPEYDYDLVNEEVLLRAGVKDGRVALPSGMTYRVLALPKLRAMSLEVARKLADLSAAGATIVGPKPERAIGRQDDGELRRIADELWDSGKVTSRTAREAVGIAPDVEGTDDWIHRRAGEAHIYFVCNQKAEPVRREVTFRVAGKQPELWDAVTGQRRDAGAFQQQGGRTTVPLELPAYGSTFVIFRRPATADGRGRNWLSLAPVAELAGPWEVTFGTRKLKFEKLVDWTTRPEVRYFSGTATYRKSFSLPPSVVGRRPLYLDLGRLSMLAEVRLNGKNLGVVWAPPFRVDIGGIAKPSDNVLEVDIVNGWWNHLVGDPNHERTQTNIRLKPGLKPQTSGLLGPVTIESSEASTGAGK